MEVDEEERFLTTELDHSLDSVDFRESLLITIVPYPIHVVT